MGKTQSPTETDGFESHPFYPITTITTTLIKQMQSNDISESVLDEWFVHTQVTSLHKFPPPP